MKKSNPNIKAQILRSAFYLLLLLGICAIPFALAQRSFNGRTKSAMPSKQTRRTLSFADRVAYQRAVEEVYWQHRIWPKENSKPKPSLDDVMSSQQIEKKVEDYLRDSEALEAYWQKPITSEQLQAEMERMARGTKQPEVLRELFEALGNDPSVIAECLARPVLTERLIVDLSARDKGQRFALLQTQAAGSKFSIPLLGIATYTLPEIDPCTDDTWTPTSVTNAPATRDSHTAVWTGSEMIVWGGCADAACDQLLFSGGRYNPSTDSWTATSTTNVPEARYYQTAVWTGSEMIVWGGYGNGFLNTGGRYNLSSDSWTATSTTNVPSTRSDHTAVWTGGEMIIWGGFDGGWVVNTGGRYNLATESWTATSTTNAPSVRELHTAIWTGSEMIVWGGFDFSNDLNTGGRYNPSTDSWTATSTNAPGGRDSHTAVWTGGEMIVWGGSGQNGKSKNSGGRYNPSTDSWTATSTTNVPEARYLHTAVWTGAEMIVWGGSNGSIVVNTGGRYCAAPSGPTPTPTATPTPGSLQLRARQKRVGGINTVQLNWRGGARSPNIDIYRNNMLIATQPNDPGVYIDSTGDTGRAQYTYRVCEAGTRTCSNEVLVRFPQ